MNLLYFSSGLITGIIILLIYFKFEKVKWITRFENEERIFQLVENSKDIIYYYEVKPEFKFKYMSPSIEQVFGEGTVERGYQNPFYVFEHVHPDDYDILYKKATGAADYSKPIIQRWSDDKGQYKWFEEYTTPVYKNGELVAIEGIMREITEKIKLQQELEYQITHDALTGIYNRDFFEKNLRKYNKEADKPVAILLCDLDELKYFNDHFGHKKGDEYIRETTSFLRRFFTEDNMIVARMGGDEFAVLIVDKTDEEVENLCKELSNKISHYNSNSDDMRIRMSIGYAFSEQSIGNVDNLLARADKNMYQDKNRKKVSKKAGNLQK